MKAIALTILKKLLDKYGVWALSYLLTKLFSFLFNKYGNAQVVVKEAEEIIEALQYVVKSAKDGIVTEDEIMKATPIIKKALSFK